MKFHELTAPAIAGIDRDRTLVLLPIAAVEQHGPHLPTGTDTIICGAVAEAVEARAPESVLLAPVYWLGASAHHLRFGATLTAELSTYVATLCELARPLLEDGFRRLIFLNGHGGNVDPLKVALRELQLEFPQSILSGASYWSIAEEVIASGLEGEDRFVGHACEFETSMIQHLRPELVDEFRRAHAGPWLPDVVEGLFVSRDMKQRTRAGCTGRPDLASAEKGAALFEGIVARVGVAVKAMLAEPIPD
ncbi:MAG: creatininase family protein [Verrucomicrobiae bacterium]|nr:creatininase family protein [Verrucomicrobiae bacterium]MCP5541179.1 creatininase family protein [Akkermansiaceae bacterium]MCP5550481.1 creatininase family protein [Akkermansiaceae bacterium]